jgi:hypothetical protein
VGRGVFIAEGCYQLFECSGCLLNLSVCLVLFVQWINLCLVCPGISQRVFQKVVYIYVVPRTSTILFTECTSSGPHAYSRTKNSSVRLLDLAYIRSKGLVFGSYFLRD